MGLPALALFSPEDYLTMENRSQEKHELYDGHIIAMAGGSRAHGIIQVNIINGTSNRFRDKKRPCRPFGSDTRVYVGETKYFYPDVSIFCGKPEVDSLNNWRNPEVIVEILSESTASFDQNEKAAAYRQIASLKELILIDSRVKAITIFQKQSDGAWLERSYDHKVAAVTLAGEELPLDEIYLDVFQDAV
jgi:Uma2 family endonuclease